MRRLSNRETFYATRATGTLLHCNAGGLGHPAPTAKLNSLPAKKKSPLNLGAAAAPPNAPAHPSDDKGRIFLIDTMSFIFRAYHAMARQRPMSTKTGLPTAATYVFVNMLRKLREDFSPRISGGCIRRGRTHHP